MSITDNSKNINTSKTSSPGKRKDTKYTSFGRKLAIFWLIFVVFGTIFYLGMIYERARSGAVTDSKGTEYRDSIILLGDIYDLNSSGNISYSSGDFYFFASKNGTTAYNVTCMENTRIKDGNIIYFESAGEATSAGYKIAESC